MRFNHTFRKNRRFTLVAVLAVFFERTQKRISRISVKNFFEIGIIANVTVNSDVFVVKVIQFGLCFFKFVVRAVINLNVDNIADRIAQIHSQKHLCTVFRIDFDIFSFNAVEKF